MGFGDPIMLYDPKKERQEAAQINQYDFTQPIGTVTDRSQIIDPYEIVRIEDYGNNRIDRAQYENDLAQAVRYAEQQEASYQEWYNSESQQIARQKAAGLNPDLAGMTESGTASDVAAPQSSPMANIPTNLDVANSVMGALSSIAGVFTNVSSIMGTLSQIGLNVAQESLVGEQVDAQHLANIGNFEKLVYGGVSDSLAQAMSVDGTAFDMAKWFDGQDFEPMFKSYAPEDNKSYRDAFNRILKNSRQIHTDAYSRLGATEDGRRKYLNHLASGYYDTSDDVMTGQLKVIVNAYESLDFVQTNFLKRKREIERDYMDRIDVAAAAAGFNANTELGISRADFETDYYNAMQGDLMAEYDIAIKKSQSIVDGASADVYHWLRNKFNVNNNAGVAWQILAGAHMGWKDFLASKAAELGNVMTGNIDPKLYQKYKDFYDKNSGRAESLPPNVTPSDVDKWQVMFGD